MAAAKSSHLQTQSQQVRSPHPHAAEAGDPSTLDIHRPRKDAAGTAEYIAFMTAELAKMSGLAKLDMLTYFLNMARLEAEFHMRRRR
ncbi:MAG: hypothetical protein EPN75_09760 [Beijerinckiaceae bacterium]|nr:MAG: hypothetical protein EPN75_09760 [Beijerinckiaceae bacterium]